MLFLSCVRTKCVLVIFVMWLRASLVSCPQFPSLSVSLNLTWLVYLVKLKLYTCPFSLSTENNLSIPKVEAELNITRKQDFTIPCNIREQSSLESKFQVTWFWQKETGTKRRPLFTVYRNATLQDRFGENVQLRFGHPDPRQFSLTFLNPRPENSGLYFCEVEEWLPSLSRGWRKVAVEKSGNLTVSIVTEGTFIITQLVVSLSKY